MLSSNKCIHYIVGIFIVCQCSCVQKSYERTVKLTLDVSQVPNVKTVGVRGEGKPLSWDEDLVMTAILPDSLYTIEMTGITGYKFVEIKYVVNGQFELQDQPNRRIYFNENSPVTMANHTFNTIK